MHRARYFLSALALLVGGCANYASAPQAPADRNALSQLQTRQAQMAAQLHELQGEVRFLREQLSMQQQQPASPGASRVTQAGSAPGEMTAKAAPAPTPAAPTSATELYTRAFADYASGRYPQAIAGFETFLREHPGNEYAGNALFWIGECYFAQQDYRHAATAFLRVASEYPEAGRAPDALLRAANAYQSLDQPGEANRVLNLLRQRYPHSGAAQKGLEP